MTAQQSGPSHATPAIALAKNQRARGKTWDAQEKTTYEGDMGKKTLNGVWGLKKAQRTERS